MEQLAQRKKKIVIGVSGASGTIYAINLVKKLKEYPMVETHGIISPWAKQNLKLESDLSLNEFESLFDYYYSNKDLGAAVASGSFLTDGMINRTGKYENSRRYLCWFRRQPDCTCC